MKMEPIRSSETSAIKTQTAGNYPKRNILQAYINLADQRLLRRATNVMYQFRFRLCLNRLHNITYQATPLAL